MNHTIKVPVDRILFLIWQTSHALGALMAEDLAGLGLTTSQFGVIVHVSREPGISAAELSRRLNLTRQGVRSALEPLYDRGLIVRKPHPVNLRVQGLYVTDRGDAIAADADMRIVAIEKRMLESFSDTDQTLFYSYLRRTTESVNPTALDRSSIRPR